MQFLLTFSSVLIKDETSPRHVKKGNVKTGGKKLSRGHV